MALPTDIAGLYAWYKAGSLSLLEGDAVSSWLDSSGNGRHMGIGAAPIYRANQIAGYPAVHFPAGGLKAMTGAIGWLANLASHTVFLVWKGEQSGSGGIVTALGGSASECVYQNSDTQISKRWSSTTTTYTAAATCPINEWHYSCGFQNGTVQIGISVDSGAEVTTATAGTRNAAPTADGLLCLDGGAYAAGRIAEVIIYSSALSAGDKALVNTYLRDKYFSAAPGQQEQIRDATSRRLWLLRRPMGILEVTVPLWALDADILDRVAVESRVGPAPAAAGWGGKKWQRHAFSIQRISEVNPATNTVKLQLLDRRPLDVLFWDSARTDKRNSSARQGGVARIVKGLGFALEPKFSRLSKAWVENPADPTSLVECQQTERAINQTGELFEEARTNEVTRSSFASGTTGLTLAGTGTNGSAIAVDTTDLLFGTETTPNGLKFTAGSPHAAELRATFPATASWANTACRVSIDHKTDNGEGLYWRLQRSGDSYYWDDGSAAWGAGSVDNACATSATRDPANRTISKAITMDATSRTLTLSVFLQTVGTASRVSHLYHAQIERGSFASSRIVTDGAAGTRVATALTNSVTTAAKILEPALGTFYCEFTPSWSTADLPAGTVAMLYGMSLAGGAGYDLLYYAKDTGAFHLLRLAGGVSYYATKATTVTRGTTYKLAGRWTGPDLELDLPGYTLSVFVNGAKGTDATAVAPTFTSPETLHRGAFVGVNHANGFVRDVRIYPYALADEEIARLP